ncbi:MAG: oligosaccharide flippase family protein, partial [Candidatus Aminicenantes bacterium]|nr:oligosaccharide flippase family protein [Candidatus Aminicenantes bacterium]
MSFTEIDISKELKTILKGSISAFIGRIFYTGFAFILSILIARLYGAKIMGEFFLCLTVISILSVFSVIGLNNGLLKFIPIYNSEKKYEYLKGTFISVSFFVFAVAA